MRAALFYCSRGDVETRRLEISPLRSLRTLREPKNDISRRGRREPRVFDGLTLRVSTSPREQFTAFRAGANI